MFSLCATSTRSKDVLPSGEKIVGVKSRLENHKRTSSECDLTLNMNNQAKLNPESIQTNVMEKRAT